MEYLPQHDLCFLHVPKTAGQAVRAALRAASPIDQTPIALDLGVEPSELKDVLARPWTHPELGPVHVTHLPPSVLRAHFPRMWAAFAGSRSFCLTRPPRERFLSALMQRMQEFGGTGGLRASDPAVRAEAARVCEVLAAQSGPMIAARHAHFVRQVEFADLDGRRAVTAVFPMDASDAIEAWLAREVGLSVALRRAHFRRQPRPWARALVPAARFVGRRLMTRGVRQALYPLWTGSAAFANARDSYGAADLGAEVEDFIAAHYAADAALHREALAAAADLRAGGRP